MRNSEKARESAPAVSSVLTAAIVPDDRLGIAERNPASRWHDHPRPPAPTTTDWYRGCTTAVVWPSRGRPPESPAVEAVRPGRDVEGVDRDLDRLHPRRVSVHAEFSRRLRDVRGLPMLAPGAHHLRRATISARTRACDVGPSAKSAVSGDSGWGWSYPIVIGRGAPSDVGNRAKGNPPARRLRGLDPSVF